MRAIATTVLTLIVFLIVVAIISILAAIAVPNLLSAAGFFGLHGGATLIPYAGSFGIAIVFLGFLVAAPLLLLMRAFGAGSRRENGKRREEEERATQQFHVDLARMEERIETLETILLDRVKSRR
ncbi:MAG TPA: hypothetical protein VM492_13990 [Sumerlaeia bacterium]|nr:hypothetical protein [Sumerlaeia bacterium]